jgi:hypothetical protein
MSALKIALLVQNQETSLGKGCRGIPCRSARCPRIFFSFPKSFGENALGPPEVDHRDHRLTVAKISNYPEQR